MTRFELVAGSAVFVTVITSGLASVRYVDRHVGRVVARQAPSGPQGACVDADGSWKNWSWANVPTGSPRCKPDGERPAARKIRS
jgi:hypothetical protein